MSRGRRIKPSTVEGRRRQAELGQIISSPRTSKSEREAALEELNTLAPIAGSGSLLADEDSKPSKRDLDALVERAEARRAGEESILLPSPPALLSAADIRAVSGMDLRSATAEWYRLVQSQWPEVGLKRTVQRASLLRWRIDTLKGTVAESFADYWEPREAEFERDMEFNARFATASPEQRDNMIDQRLGWMRTNEPATPAPSIPRIAPPSGPPSKVPAPVQGPTFALRSAPEVRVPEPEPTPIQAAGMDLAARAALIMATDGWLTKLSMHSPEMRERIIASLSDELLRVGCVSGDFCARTYNALRPRAVSQYPERRF